MIIIILVPKCMAQSDVDLSTIPAGESIQLVQCDMTTIHFETPSWASTSVSSSKKHVGVGRSDLEAQHEDGIRIEEGGRGRV